VSKRARQLDTIDDGAGRVHARSSSRMQARVSILLMLGNTFGMTGSMDNTVRLSNKFALFIIISGAMFVAHIAGSEDKMS